MTITLAGFTQDEALNLMLLGLQSEHSRVSNRISELKQELNGTPAKPELAAVQTSSLRKPKHKRHTMSAEGKAAIRKAQLKRWAKIHAAKHQALKSRGRKAA